MSTERVLLPAPPIMIRYKKQPFELQLASSINKNDFQGENEDAYSDAWGSSDSSTFKCVLYDWLLSNPCQPYATGKLHLIEATYRIHGAEDKADVSIVAHSLSKDS